MRHLPGVSFATLARDSYSERYVQRVKGVLELNQGAVGDCLWGRGTGGEEAEVILPGVAGLVLDGMADIEVAAAWVVVSIRVGKSMLCCVLGNPC